MPEIAEPVKGVEEPFGRGDFAAAAAAAAAAIAASGSTRTSDGQHDLERDRSRDTQPELEKQIRVDEHPESGPHRSIFGPFHDDKQDKQRHRDFEVYDSAPMSVPALAENIQQDDSPRENVMRFKGDTEANRDSAVHLTDSPLISHEQFHDNVRDSGYVPSPTIPHVATLEGPREKFLNVQRPPRQLTPTSSAEDVRTRSVTPRQHPTTDEHKHMQVDVEADPSYDVHVSRGQSSAHYVKREHQFPLPHMDYEEEPIRTFTPERIHRHPSPVDSTTKDRSSNVLFDSSPSNRAFATPEHEVRSLHRHSSGLHRTASIHGHPSHGGSHEGSLHQAYRDQSPPRDITSPVYSQRPNLARDSYGVSISPPKTPLGTIKEGQPRDDMSRDVNAKSQTKSQPPSTTSRSRRNRPEPIEPSSSTYDPVNDKGKGRARDMAGVYVSFAHSTLSHFSSTDLLVFPRMDWVKLQDPHFLQRDLQVYDKDEVFSRYKTFSRD